MEQFGDCNYFGNQYNSSSYKMTTKRLCSIVEPDSVSFKMDPSSCMKYSNNTRTMLLNEIELKISFVPNIGISDTEEKTVNADGYTIIHRKLIDYHIN